MADRKLVFLALLLLALPGLALPAATAAADAPSAPGPETAPAPTVVRAVAVSQTPQGLVGSVANVSITQQDGGGLLFMDTQPYTQVDMQGSARLAVRVAGAITGIDVSQRDFFFVVRSAAPIIGGPSAGAVMTVGAVAALKGWDISPHVLMTGTINPDGSVGPVGGIPEKAAAAAQQGARVFLFPAGEERTARSTPDGYVLVDMRRYCERELRIECRPVAHVDDAIAAFTGHKFTHLTSEGAGDGARFREVMQPLARGELDRAQDAVAKAREHLQQAPRLPPALRADLSGRIDTARVALLDGEEALEAQHPYTAASKAFQAAIEARYVSSVVEHVAARDPARHVAARIADAQADLDEASARAAEAQPQGLTELEAVGAAQQRVTQAERMLATARHLARSDAPLDALAQTAFAHERARTIGWWLDIATAFGHEQDEAALDAERVRVEARQSLGETLQLLAYVQQSLANRGRDAQALNAAWELHSRAQQDLDRGFAAAALFQAFEAQVRASVTLESLGFRESGVPQERLDRARAEAERAIAEARAKGVEPVLAASSFEFASDLPPGVDQLVHYDLARIVARSTDFFLATRDGGSGDRPTPSRYVGTPETLEPVGGAWTATVGAVGLAAWWVPFLLGAAVALPAGLTWRARRRAPPRVRIEPAPPLRLPPHPTVRDALDEAPSSR